MKLIYSAIEIGPKTACTKIVEALFQGWVLVIFPLAEILAGKNTKKHPYLRWWYLCVKTPLVLTPPFMANQPTPPLTFSPGK